MDLPFGENTPQAAARRPQMAVSFSSGSDFSGGGLMDSVSSVVSAVGIELSSDSVDPWQRSLEIISSQTALAPRVDQASLSLAADTQSPEFGVGDSGDIQLGYDDDPLHTVFTGDIIRVQTSIDRRVTLTVCNAAFKLSQRRTNQSFEQQSAGDIVQALADLAEVDTETIASGIDFPYYVIDDGKNLYQHIAHLAQKCGLIAFITTANKLNFAAADSGPAAKTFNYGVDLIHIKASNAAAKIDQLTVVGAGAAGSQGAAAWSWLIKDPQSVSASVGDGSNTRLISDASLRSADAVQQAAAAKLFAARQQASKATLTVVGAAEINAGSRIEITDVPLGELNGIALVESARHRYSKHGGFTTELVVLMETGEGLDSLLSGALAGVGGLL